MSFWDSMMTSTPKRRAISIPLNGFGAGLLIDDLTGHGSRLWTICIFIVFALNVYAAYDGVRWLWRLFDIIDEMREDAGL
jgi:hypothetical protein